MLKQFTSVATATVLFCLPAMAAPPAPVISGNYILTETQLCPVGGLGSSPGTEVSGIANFHANGTVTSNIYVTQNTPFALVSQAGLPTPYSNTSTTITVGTNTYKASYGGVKNGKATYVSAIAVIAGPNGPCADLFTLQLQ